MSIWFKENTLEAIQKTREKCMVDHIGIEFVEITENSLSARMPIDERTKQPFGIMHGGASAALAETVGSVAANLTLNYNEKIGVGLEISTSHLKMAKEGFVTAIATPIQLGNKVQIWQIHTYNDQKELVAFTKLSVMILDKRL